MNKRDSARILALGCHPVHTYSCLFALAAPRWHLEHLFRPAPLCVPICYPPSLSSSSATHTYMVTYLSCLEDDCRASYSQRMLSWKHVERPGNLCRIHGSILHRVTCVPFSCLFVHRRLENVKYHIFVENIFQAIATLVTHGNNCIKENCRCSWYNEIQVTEIADLC